MKARKPQHVNVCLSLPKELRDRAREAAYADNRSLSSYVASLLQRQLSREVLSRPPASN